jgi:hypothetical protein
MDIAESGKNEQRWLFYVESANTTKPRLSVFLDPPLQSSIDTTFVSELSNLMEIPLEDITVNNITEYFPYDAESPFDLLHSIDKAV